MRFKQSSFRLLLQCLFFGFFITGCQQSTYTERTQLLLIDQNQEFALGSQEAQKILQKSKPIVGTKASNMVQSVGSKIAKSANRSDYQWEFYLIEDKSVNAFCLPGGKIFVYTGLFELVKSESQLATVISHEVAHALLRHGAERMSMAQVSQFGKVILNLLVQSQAPQYASLVDQVYTAGTTYGVILPYSRKHEYEADSLGLKLMNDAGFDLDEAVNFWGLMIQNEKSRVPDFFSTHPSSVERVKNIKNEIRKLK